MTTTPAQPNYPDQTNGAKTMSDTTQAKALTYEAWRISFQSSEGAARAAFARMAELEGQAAAKCLHQIAEPAPQGKKVYAALPESAGDSVDFGNGAVDIDWNHPAPAGGTSLYTADQMRAFADATAALRAAPAADAREVPAAPEQGSTVINDACWKFIEAMPHELPGRIFNDLKPAVYAAIRHYHASLAAAPSQEHATQLAGGAQTPERQRMTAGRASFFMERFLREEKLLGPNEQAALHFVIDMLAAASALEAPAAPAVPDERQAFEHYQCDRMRRDLQELTIQADGRYDCDDIQAEWEVWQARAALAAAPQAPAAPVGEAQIAAVMELVKEWSQRDLIAVEAGIDALSDEHSEKEAQEARRLDGEAQAAYRAIEAALRNLLAAAPAAPAVDAREVDGMYYLQDARWSAMVGNCPSFWRLGGGYTTSLDDAERFTLEAAMKQHKCRATDLPWLCSELDTLRRPTIDCQYMPRSWGDQRDAIAAQAKGGNQS